MRSELAARLRCDPGTGRLYLARVELSARHWDNPGREPDPWPEPQLADLAGRVRRALRAWEGCLRYLRLPVSDWGPQARRRHVARLVSPSRSDVPNRIDQIPLIWPKDAGRVQAAVPRRFAYPPALCYNLVWQQSLAASRSSRLVEGRWECPDEQSSTTRPAHRHGAAGMLLHILISNAVSTLVDNAVFITIALLGVMPVLPLIAEQCAVKIAVTPVGIPAVAG